MSSWCAIGWVMTLLIFGLGCRDVDDGQQIVSPDSDAAIPRMDAGLSSQDAHLDALSDVALSEVSDVGADKPWQPIIPEVSSFPACDDLQETVSVTLESLESDRAARLKLKAQKFDIVMDVFGRAGTGLQADLNLGTQENVDLLREWLESTILNGDLMNVDVPDDLVVRTGKSAGLYGGVGIAADAFRYMVLRDQGANCDAVARARDALQAGIEAMHMATAITGKPGVIARAIARKDLPGDGFNQTVPLFDDDGNPLPETKNNGTWRDDQSGLYADYIWEDSCSRDMYVGWALAFASAWEAIRNDGNFSDETKRTLIQDAYDLLRSLENVGEEGYDLEIMDADGRRTYHGTLHENSIERIYAPGFNNGFNALLSTGIVAALTSVSNAPEQIRYLNTLLEERGLLDMAETSLIGLDLGPGSNFSGYNMAFTGAWLVTRYVSDFEQRAKLMRTLDTALYRKSTTSRMPIEQDQAFYHLIYIQSRLDHDRGMMSSSDDAQILADAIEKVRDGLSAFPEPPFVGESILNCDEAEIESGSCIGDDGTDLPLLGYVGWNDELVAEVPVPMSIRPHSNYYWRSNPYAVNGGQGDFSLLPANDFRFVYWAGRALKMVE